MTLVAQHHDSLSSSIARCQRMGLEVGPARKGIATEFGSLYHVLEDAPHVAVQLLLTDAAVLDTFYYAPDFDVGARVHKVVAGLHG